MRLDKLHVKYHKKRWERQETVKNHQLNILLYLQLAVKYFPAIV